MDYVRLKAERDFPGKHEPPPPGRVGDDEWLAVMARNLRWLELDRLLLDMRTARVERDLLAEQSRQKEGW